MRVNVQGGTNAGTRAPLAQPASEWAHVCTDTTPSRSIVLSGHFRNCPRCYTPRPKTTR